MQRSRKYFGRLVWAAMLTATFVCTPLTELQAQAKKADDKKGATKEEKKKDAAPDETNIEENVSAPAPMTPQDEAMMAAIRNGGTAQVLKLLNDGANAHGRNRDGWSMLHYAAQGGVPEIVEALLDRKAEADTRHKTGVTPLMMAAEAGHLEVVRALLARGADANLASKEGQTALDMAKAKNRAQVVEVLAPLAKEPSNKPVKPVNDDTNNVKVEDNDVARERALTDAASKGRTASVEKLLAQGVKPNSQNQDGWTALSLAAKSGYVDTVSALLERGADPNAKHKTGMTALMLAANGGHTQTVEALIEGGSDLDEVIKGSGESALSMATKHNYAEIIKVLKAAGAKR